MQCLSDSLAQEEAQQTDPCTIHQEDHPTPYIQQTFKTTGGSLQSVRVVLIPSVVHPLENPRDVTRDACLEDHQIFNTK